MKTYSLKIVQDDEPQNPREEFDHAGTMVCFHKRYRLGDSEHPYKQGDFNSWEEVRETIEADCAGADPPGCYSLPLYLMDHSGLSIQTKPFACRWDSGQVGFIYMPVATALSEFGPYANPPITTPCPELEERALRLLESEVEEYRYYLEGDIYGYIIADATGEHVDSCWGFYGEACAREEGEAALARLQSEEALKEQERGMGVESTEG